MALTVTGGGSGVTVVVPTLPSEVSAPLTVGNLPALDLRYVQPSNTVTTLYSSDGSFTTVGAGSTARGSILPPDAMTGKANGVPVQANLMSVGSYLEVEVHGMVSVAIALTSTLVLTPWVSTGSVVTDIGSPNNAVPNVGMTSRLSLKATYLQTKSGLLVTGHIYFGGQNRIVSPQYEINSQHLITASDPTVDRFFGIDAAWLQADIANIEQTFSAVSNLWRRS